MLNVDWPVCVQVKGETSRQALISTDRRMKANGDMGSPRLIISEWCAQVTTDMRSLQLMSTSDLHKAQPMQAVND